MRLIDIARWQWMLIGLVLGLVVGYLRHNYTDAEPSGYGSMTQLEFERAINWTRDANASGDQPPILGKINVIHMRDPRHPDRKTYAVTLMHWNGSRLEVAQRDDGMFDMKYRPKIFVAPIPYLVAGKTAAMSPTTDKDMIQRLAERLHIKDPDPPGTVLDYLRTIEKTHGIGHSYKWWREQRATIVIWLTGCFIVVGVVWPTVINLATYGTFGRPREEPGTDLSKVRTGPSSQQHAPVVSEADMAKVAEMADKLEQDLGTVATTPSTVAPTSVPSTPEPPKLQSAPPPETDAERQAREAREFGRDAGDFYPTERHHTPKNPGA